MLCAVAIIGVGYAAFSNTATARTYNEGNNAIAGYMVITPGTEASENWDPIVSNVVESFSTYHYRPITAAGPPIVYGTPATAYYLAGVAAGTDDAAGYYVKDVASKNFTVENQTGGILDSIAFKAKASAAVGNADFKYFLKVVDGAGTAVYFDIDTSDVSKDVSLASSLADGAKRELTVSVCIGYKPNCVLPSVRYGDVSSFAEGSVPSPLPSGFDQLARSTGNAPADMAATTFAFAVTVTA